MSDDFGQEFVGILGIVPGYVVHAEQDTRGEGLDIGQALDSIIARAQAASSGLITSGFILFFPPGRYAVPVVPERRNQTYVFPPNLELFFSPGALLRPALGVDLVIEGTIRAGKYQIFGYDRYSTSSPPGVITAPLGHIILTSLLIPEVYPEWWGAFMPANVNAAAGSASGQDSSDALQAAIDAACVYRDYPDGRVRRPFIPVVLGGEYQCYRSLDVQLPRYATSLELVLRGSGGLAPIAGGPRSIIRVHEVGSPVDPSACVLRLGPGVDFDIQDVSLKMPAEDPVAGCIDVVCHDLERTPRRGLLRRCALNAGREYGLRIGGSTSALPRQFVVDSCEIIPMNISYQSLRGVSVSGGECTMLHIDGALMGTGVLQLDANRVPIPAPRCATIYQVGASVLVRATQFQSGNGPRPSQVGNEPGNIDLTIPDGQEVFLDAPDDPKTRATSQFTAMQCECQGWWFLARPRRGDEQVVLLCVAHENVNWTNNKSRYRGRTPNPNPDLDHRGHPPSVVWLGEGGQCALVACRFQDSVLTNNPGFLGITRVGLFFKTARLVTYTGHLGRLQYFRDSGVPEAIIRPPDYDFRDLPSPESQAYDLRLGGVVPIRRFPIDTARP